MNADMNTNAQSKLLDKIDDMDICRGLAQSYEFFAQVMLMGPVAERQLIKDEMPDLWRFIANEDPEQLEANHYEMFGLQVFPYAGVYLNDSPMAGGPCSEQVLAYHRRSNYQWQNIEDSPDSMVEELKFLAYLMRQPACLSADSLKLQHEFMGGHFLAWAIIFCADVAHQNSQFYRQTVDLLLGVLELHVGFLEKNGYKMALQPQKSHPQLDITSDSTGLKKIADYIANPAGFGTLITKHEITEMARKLGLSRGFGSRFQMIESLLNSSADFDKLFELIAAMDQILDSRCVKIRDLPIQLSSMGMSWVERLLTSKAMLKGMLEKAQNA
jgi:TorA maturation chaperone TorD